MSHGDVPSVLALSFGNGDRQRDSIVGVFLDSEGHLREHFKIDNLIAAEEERDYNATNKEILVEFLRRRRPQMIAISGFSTATKALRDNVVKIGEEVSALIMREGDDDDEDDDEELTEQMRSDRAQFVVSYMFDDVARIYQNSTRAAMEFPELSKLGKYCVGLGRYVQSPLNEYAALGPDLLAINYSPGQKHVRGIDRNIFTLSLISFTDLAREAYVIS